MAGHAWTQAELDAVRSVYPIGTWKQILDALPGRTKASIRCQVISQGIKRTRNPRVSWTGAEYLIVRKLYPLAPWPTICAALPRHHQSAIAKQANMLGLKRDGATRQSRIAIIRELRATRRRLGISSENLANRLGSHRVQLAKWERGEQMPRLQSFFDWIEALGFRIELQRQGTTP